MWKNHTAPTFYVVFYNKSPILLELTNFAQAEKIMGLSFRLVEIRGKKENGWGYGGGKFTRQ